MIYPLRDLDKAVIERVDGKDIDGNPKVVETIDTNCTIQDVSKAKFDRNGKAVNVSAIVFKKGNLFPSIPIPQGHITIRGNKCDIFSFKRIRDLQGRVHHIEIEVL